MSFRHKMITGTSGYGKSTIALIKANLLLKARQKVIVWSGVYSDWPKGVSYTDSIDQFEEMLSKPDNFNSHVFMDEAHFAYIKTKESTHPFIWELPRAGRHRGQMAYFITQKPTSLPLDVRLNTAEAYCFRLGSKYSAKQVWEDFGEHSINGVPLHEAIVKLPKYTYMRILPDMVDFFKIVKKGRVFSTPHLYGHAF